VIRFIKDGGLSLIFWMSLFLAACILDGCVMTICRGLRIANDPNNYDHQQDHDPCFRK